MKKEFVAFRDELKKMAQHWEDQAASWSKKIRMWKMEMDTAKMVRRVKRSIQPAKHIVKVATDTQVHAESRRHATSPIKRSATLSRKHQQARPVPIRCQHPTARTRKLRRRSRSKASKAGSRVGSQHAEHEKLRGSPSTQLTFQILFPVTLSCIEEVLSLMGRIGTNGKRPFDRGRVWFKNLEDKVLWRAEY
ncbi:hypothetical protein YC2023_081562 [Brassica napus]